MSFHTLSVQKDTHHFHVPIPVLLAFLVLLVNLLILLTPPLAPHVHQVIIWINCSFYCAISANFLLILQIHTQMLLHHRVKSAHWESFHLLVLLIVLVVLGISLIHPHVHYALLVWVFFFKLRIVVVFIIIIRNLPRYIFCKRMFSMPKWICITRSWSNKL